MWHRDRPFQLAWKALQRGLEAISNPSVVTVKYDWAWIFKLLSKQAVTTNTATNGNTS